jgi:hypothetical protein
MPRNPHLLCDPCRAGKHDPATHSEVGCTDTIGPPPTEDYVCDCRVTVKRSDAWEVITESEDTYEG